MEGEELRDDQWERIKRFVPGGRKGKRGPRSDGRRFFNALLRIARSGARWRDLPERFGPYQLHDIILDQGGEPVIPPRRHRKHQHAYDKSAYQNRWGIEGFFAKLKQWRRIATRYDKLAASFLGFVKLASIMLRLK
ncbi:MAG: transposase [Xanthobacteraceae bacterium]